MKKNTLFKKEVATKRIEFKDEDGNLIPGEFLDIKYAKVKRPYSEIKAFFRMIKDGQALIKSQEDVKKRLAVTKSRLEAAESDDEKNGIQLQIDALNAEAVKINERVEDSIAPFADYLIPDDSSPRRVLLEWDLLDDNDEPIPATRKELEDLPAETIIFIAGELMSADEVGEAKPAK